MTDPRACARAAVRPDPAEILLPPRNSILRRAQIRTLNEVYGLPSRQNLCLIAVTRHKAEIHLASVVRPILHRAMAAYAVKPDMKIAMAISLARNNNLISASA